MAWLTRSVAAVLVLLACSVVFAASAHSVVVRPTGSWRDATARLAITYPATWHVATRRLTTITQPVQRFVVYSGSTPRGLVQRTSPSADQALAILMEQTSVSAADLEQFPRRPRRFTVSHLGGVESFAGNRWAERVFRDDRRAFYVFIWIGVKAQSQLPILLGALDSLRVA